MPTPSSLREIGPPSCLAGHASAGIDMAGYDLLGANLVQSTDATRLSHASDLKKSLAESLFADPPPLSAAQDRSQEGPGRDPR